MLNEAQRIAAAGETPGAEASTPDVSPSGARASPCARRKAGDESGFMLAVSSAWRGPSRLMNDERSMRRQTRESETASTVAERGSSLISARSPK